MLFKTKGKNNTFLLTISSSIYCLLTCSEFKMSKWFTVHGSQVWPYVLLYNVLFSVDQLSTLPTTDRAGSKDFPSLKLWHESATRWELQPISFTYKNLEIRTHDDNGIRSQLSYLISSFKKPSSKNCCLWINHFQLSFGLVFSLLTFIWSCKSPIRNLTTMYIDVINSS